jgi:hypothetical protein
MILKNIPHNHINCEQIDAATKYENVEMSKCLLEKFLHQRFYEDNIVRFQIVAAIVCLLLLTMICLPVRKMRQGVREKIERCQKEKRQNQSNDSSEYSSRCNSLMPRSHTTRKMSYYPRYPLIQCQSA